MSALVLGIAICGMGRIGLILFIPQQNFARLCMQCVYSARAVDTPNLGTTLEVILSVNKGVDAIALWASSDIYPQSAPSLVAGSQPSTAPA